MDISDLHVNTVRDPFLLHFMETCNSTENRAPQGTNSVSDVKIDLLTMETPSQWREFVHRLRVHSLIDANEALIFGDKPPKLPLLWHQFQEWLVLSFFGNNLDHLEDTARSLDESLFAVETWIKHLDLKHMSQKEIYTTMIILEEIENAQKLNKNKLNTIVHHNKQQIADLEVFTHIYDAVDQARKIKRINHHNNNTNTTNDNIRLVPSDFQKRRHDAIVNSLQSNASNGYTFPNQIKPLPIEATACAKRYLGFESSTGIPIEVLQVSNSVDPVELERITNRYCALRSLILSPYFAKPKGKIFDDTESTFSMLFSAPEAVGKAILLPKLLKKGPFSENCPLFIHLANEIRKAMTDILYMCPHTLFKEITLSNVIVSNSGITVHLDGLEFGPPRPEASMINIFLDQGSDKIQWREGFLQREARMLKWYGNMLLQMLTGRTLSDDYSVRTLSELSPRMRALIKVCHAAERTLEIAYELGQSNGETGSVNIDKYREGIVRELEVKLRHKLIYEVAKRPNLSGSVDEDAPWSFGRHEAYGALHGCPDFDGLVGQERIAQNMNGMFSVRGTNESMIRHAEFIKRTLGGFGSGADVNEATREAAELEMLCLLEMNSVNSRIVTLEDLDMLPFADEGRLVGLAQVTESYEVKMLVNEDNKVIPPRDAVSRREEVEDGGTRVDGARVLGILTES